MSITLELSPEEELRLRQAANSRGMDVAAYVRQKVFALEPQPFTANDATFLMQEGNRAVRTAQQELRASGVGYVFGRDGKIVRREPDGTETVLGGQNGAEPVS